MKKYHIQIFVNRAGNLKVHNLTVKATTIKDAKEQITDGNFLVVDIPLGDGEIKRTYINVEHVVEISIEGE